MGPHSLFHRSMLIGFDCLIALIKKPPCNINIFCVLTTAESMEKIRPVIYIFVPPPQMSFMLNDWIWNYMICSFIKWFYPFVFNSYPFVWDFCSRLIIFANSLDPDHARQNVGPDLGPNCLPKVISHHQKSLKTQLNDRDTNCFTLVVLLKNICWKIHRWHKSLKNCGFVSEHQPVCTTTFIMEAKKKCPWNDDRYSKPLDCK